MGEHAWESHGGVTSGVATGGYVVEVQEAQGLELLFWSERLGLVQEFKGSETQEGTSVSARSVTFEVLDR